MTGRPPRTAAAIVASAVISACRSNSASSTSSHGHPTEAQIEAQLHQDALRFAACMRGNGVSNFPDPASPGADKEFLLGRIPGSTRSRPCSSRRMGPADTCCRAADPARRTQPRR
jgi:hypothetical protein